MTWTDFGIRLLVGFFLGVGIGIERQWLRSRAILKTNVLVTLGAAMFVMLSIMTPGDASPTRISAQIVSGVGFLGGGVILREGASVRGTNTAATLWCAAAIGTLVGSGYFVQAYLGTFAVVGANLLLRPLVEAFKQPELDLDYQTTTTEHTTWKNHKSEDEDISFTEDESYTPSKLSVSELTSVNSTEHQICYSCHLICFPSEEARVLGVLFQSARDWEWQLSHIDTKSIWENRQSQQIEMIEIKADFVCRNRKNQGKQIEKIIHSLKSDSLVRSVSWQFSV
jgi:putative Mg2+ transporter-C (MgtC) family protein